MYGQFDNLTTKKRKKNLNGISYFMFYSIFFILNDMRFLGISTSRTFTLTFW
jgi:hypothetical protein